MPDLVRLFNFTEGEVADPEQVDAELDQILAAINDLDPENFLAGLLDAIAFTTGDYILSAAAGKPGWLICDGSAVVRASYPDLFAEIGIQYGPGDGSTTFNLPDWRGRVPVGLGTHVDVNALGDSDAVAVGSRSPVHSHGHAHTHSVPNHSHHITGLVGGTGSAVTSGGDAGNTYATTANPVSTPHHHNVSSSGDTDVDGGGSGVQTGGASAAATDFSGAPFITCNVFIKI